MKDEKEGLIYETVGMDFEAIENRVLALTWDPPPLPEPKRTILIVDGHDSGYRRQVVKAMLQHGFLLKAADAANVASHSLRHFGTSAKAASDSFSRLNYTGKFDTVWSSRYTKKRVVRQSTSNKHKKQIAKASRKRNRS